MTLSPAFSSIADPSKEAPNKSDQVTALLNKLRGGSSSSVKKDSSVKAKKKAPRTKALKPVKPKPKLDKLKTKRYKLTKTKPTPVKIKKPMQPSSKQTSSSRKEALLNVLHKVYVRADYGVGQPEQMKWTDSKGKSIKSSLKKSFMYGGGIGYKFNQVLRADINFQHRRLKRKAMSVPGADKPIELMDNIHRSAFLNAYLDLMDMDSYVVPYLTAGVGYTENKIKNVNRTTASSKIEAKGRASSIAWQAGAGVILRLTKNVGIDANYKYIDIGKIKLHATLINLNNGESTKLFVNERLAAHEISGGLIINF